MPAKARMSAASGVSGESEFFQQPAEATTDISTESNVRGTWHAPQRDSTLRYTRDLQVRVGAPMGVVPVTRSSLELSLGRRSSARDACCADDWSKCRGGLVHVEASHGRYLLGSICHRIRFQRAVGRRSLVRMDANGRWFARP